MRARLLVPLVALAILLGLAALTLGGGGERATLPGGAAMFPGFAATLEAAGRIELLHQGHTLVLARDGDVWRLPDHAGFPVDPPVLHTLLAGLAALRLLEPRTAEAANLSRLGLDDPARPEAAGTLVRVLAGDGAPLASVIVGRGVIGGAGDAVRRDSYVRRPDEAQTWLAQPLLTPSADWLDWVARDLADIRPEEVTGLVASRVGAATLSFARQGDHMALLAPAEHPPLDQFKLDDTGRALAGLVLRDVRRAADVPGGLVGTARITARGGLVVEVAVHRAGADVWLVLAAEGEGAAEARARWEGWAFQVDPWKEAALVPTLADLSAYAPPPAAPVAKGGARH